MIKKSFIEDSFPIKEVSEESVKEKNIRHGQISTMHIWWARRPLASSRATIYSALVGLPDDEESIKKRTNFIVDIAKWENSLNSVKLTGARSEIKEANGGIPPKILDPFSGGGSIPLEAARLGCDTYSSDYNPVATLILKCTLEYPQRYGNINTNSTGELSLGVKHGRLANDFRKWGQYVLKEAKGEISKFYKVDESIREQIGFIWARTIPCQNVSCSAEIPLMRQFWLAQKDKKKIALMPYIVEGKVEFKIVGTGFEQFPDTFDPEKGTVSRAIATCLVCGSVVDSYSMHKLFLDGKSGERLIVVLEKETAKGKTGKIYRLANEEDINLYEKANQYLSMKEKELSLEWGMSAVPDEPTPEGKGRGAERAFSVRSYNMMAWGDLFNARQKLVLITFSEKVRLAYDVMIKEGYDQEYARAVSTYLAFVVSRMSDVNSSICHWDSGWEKTATTFGRQAIPMTWDYVEGIPFSSGGYTFDSILSQIELVIENIICTRLGNISVSQSSATSLNYKDEFFDAVFTDPPYYDNVPYSYLSDFFYVWHKRMLGHLYPELFVTPLTPKSQEIVAYSNSDGGFEGGKRYFEEMLGKSFKEIYRVLKPDGIAIIVYAHKSTSAWETLINSLLSSGLVVTAAWPINTEMKQRLRANESAALASSIYIVSRKLKREKSGFYNEIRSEMREHLQKKLDTLWNAGVSGADFLISAIASSIEVFGKYERVISDDGDIITTERLMNNVREIVTNYAVKQVLHNGFSGEIDTLTRFYVLWRWAYGSAKVPFDEARKLSQSAGIDRSSQWNGGIIKKDKSFVQVLGPEDRKNINDTDIKSMIDLLHRVLILWDKGQKSRIIETISGAGSFHNKAFLRVAQAIAESLPLDSRERKLIEGFLINSKNYLDINSNPQTRLF